MDFCDVAKITKILLAASIQCLIGDSE